MNEYTPTRKATTHNISSWILAVAFIGAGVNHFISPGFYLKIMPAYLPWHKQLVLISGVCEVLGGALVLFPYTRRLAGYGLIALLLAVFPANIEATLRYAATPPVDLVSILLWLRLPFQGVLVAWVWWTCLKKPRSILG